MPTTVLRVVAATLLAVALTSGTGLSNDLWWLLDFGQAMLGEGAIPRTNERSFLAPGAPMVIHECGDSHRGRPA